MDELKTMLLDLGKEITRAKATGIRGGVLADRALSNIKNTLSSYICTLSEHSHSKEAYNPEELTAVNTILSVEYKSEIDSLAKSHACTNAPTCAGCKRVARGYEILESLTKR